MTLENIIKSVGPAIAAQCYAQEANATFEDFETLKHLGADFNYFNPGNLAPKESAITLAVAGGYLENVKHMIKLGADVNVPSYILGPLLKIAVVRGNLYMVNLLISRGADVNAIHYDESILMKAVASLNFNIVKTLVEAGADILDGSMHVVNKDGSKTMVNALSYAQNLYENNKSRITWFFFNGYEAEDPALKILNYLESVVNAKKESEMLEELLIIKDVVVNETKSDRKRL